MSTLTCDIDRTHGPAQRYVVLNRAKVTESGLYQTYPAQLCEDCAAAIAAEDGPDARPQVPMDPGEVERGVRQPGCWTCETTRGMMPSHTASFGCKSGKRSHCTCDTCF